MKSFLQILGFLPKENSSDIFIKKYKNHEDYFLEVNFEKKIINFGEKIFIGENNFQNITKSEDLVVLECVDRLIEKGYKPEDIVLEKVFPSGHGHSGRLDICVKKEEKTFLMIECKTWGSEFEKEFKNLEKNGGQLFTYFQNDKNAEFLVLYASQFDAKNNKIEYRNEIVVIDESYRETANIKDLFERWSKQTKDNGVFEAWVNAYNFESRALQMQDLKNIKQEDSSFIFNRFLEILRHNAVSDKGNAFNKIFTLFLCKVKDEDRNKSDELDFQWKIGEDDAVSFQKRLSDLYRKAMKEFLDKSVSDLSDDEFNNKYSYLKEEDRKSILGEITKVRLQKNNEFAIKDVFDEETFLENNIVLREVVELLQKFKFRYNKKQPFLGEFFELLLTTGLKQESGQFFTPVPIARFVCKSVPLVEKIKEKLKKGEGDSLLPTIIDYAAGSGHFLTESMEEIQNILDTLNSSDYSPKTKKRIDSWAANPFEWAYKYIYGIERDYRLVKTTKVGCYLHGDGVANVIHGDGLDSFEKSQKYKGKLSAKNYKTQDNPQNNGQFDFVLSNPPYSVSAFKGNTHNDTFSKDFELYKNLTDQSSEIEALFVERTKQLLDEGGVTALILPASILSNTGIYTKAREIILKYFEIIAITELGSNTFMATGTSTVILFLRRRSDYFWKTTQEKISGFFEDQNDKTINGTENIFSKYISHIFEEDENSINFEDYQSLISGEPNKNILKSDFFIEYNKKLSSKIYKTEAKKLEKILEIEKEKLLYFVLAYGQEIVLVNSGQKKEEKKFLGYEFSTRRRGEGLHAINRSKSVDECTSLYDDTQFYNPEKASTYILEAFENKPKREIHEDLKKNISRVDLIDMLTFDRVDFEKTVSTVVKKKIKYSEVWGTEQLISLEKITDIKKGKSITSATIIKGKYPVIAGGQKVAYFHNEKNREGNVITVSASGAYSGFVSYFDSPIFASDCNTIISKDENKISTFLIFEFLKSIQEEIYALQRGQAQPHVYGEDLNKIKIPLPSPNIQQKIVDECKKVDSDVRISKEKIIEKKEEISNIIENITPEKQGKLEDILSLEYGKPLPESFRLKGEFPVIGSNGISGYHNKYLIKSPAIIVGRKGSAGKLNYIEKNCFPIDTTFYVQVKNNENLKFVFHLLKSLDLEKLSIGVGVPGLNRNDAYELKVPIVNAKIQQKIVSEIEKIETEISENQKIIDEAGNKKELILKKYL